MIKISERVLHAIDLMQQGKYELALEQAAIGIDVSAQYFYKKTSSTNSDYKRFIEEYYWIIELMAFNGIDLKNSFFSNFTIFKFDMLIEKPQLSDILYHVVRCSLIHSTGIPKSLTFNRERTIVIAHEYISLPTEVIWGMLALIVFCKSNTSEKSEGNYFISYEDHSFLIRESWGKEELLRPHYDQYVKVRVALNIPPLQKTVIEG